MPVALPRMQPGSGPAGARGRPWWWRRRVLRLADAPLPLSEHLRVHRRELALGRAEVRPAGLNDRGEVAQMFGLVGIGVEEEEMLQGGHGRLGPENRGARRFGADRSLGVPHREPKV